MKQNHSYGRRDRSGAYALVLLLLASELAWLLGMRSPSSTWHPLDLPLFTAGSPLPPSHVLRFGALERVTGRAGDAWSGTCKDASRGGMTLAEVACALPDTADMPEMSDGMPMV